MEIKKGNSSTGVLVVGAYHAMRLKTRWSSFKKCFSMRIWGVFLDAFEQKPLLAGFYSLSCRSFTNGARRNIGTTETCVLKAKWQLNDNKHHLIRVAHVLDVSTTLCP